MARDDLLVVRGPGGNHRIVFIDDVVGVVGYVSPRAVRCFRIVQSGLAALFPGEIPDLAQVDCLVEAGPSAMDLYEAALAAGYLLDLEPAVDFRPGTGGQLAVRGLAGERVLRCTFHRRGVSRMVEWQEHGPRVEVAAP